MMMMVMLIASTPLYAPAHNQRAHPLCKDLLPKWVSCCFSFSYLLHLTTQALRSWSAWRTVIFLLLHGYQVKAVSFWFNLWIVLPIDNIRRGQLNFSQVQSKLIVCAWIFVASFYCDKGFNRIMVVDMSSWHLTRHHRVCSNITKTTQDMLVISKAVTKGVVSLEGDSL